VTAPTDAVSFKRYVARFDGVSNYGFVVYLPSTRELVGAINLTNVIFGAFRSGYLGYFAFAGFEGKGYMAQGLRAVARHAFKQIKLHRLEANIQPMNLTSIALVRACGFEQEGYSRKYLKIGGRWCDHERWALVKPSAR
jgi:ribosomal-protein-alanine N-acetyltransferase